MVNHGITLKSAPPSNKQKEQPAAIKQNGRFVGIAKKKNRNHRTNSLVEPLANLTDSDRASIFHDHDEAKV